MKKLISSIKNKFFKIEKKKVICFTLLNHIKIYDKDPHATEKVQRDLANIGVLTSKFDRDLFCVYLTHPDTKKAEIIKIFRKYKLKVKIKTAGKGVYKYQKGIVIFPKKLK